MSDQDEFAPEPETGDLADIAVLVKRCADVDAELRQIKEQEEALKNERKDILETRIPEIMAKTGGFTKLQVAGFTIEIVAQASAGIPAESTILKEKDEEKQAEMIERRDRAFAVLEKRAPHLLKRSYEIDFDRDSADASEAFEKHLEKMENAPAVIKGMSVHPKTLAKWYKDLRSEGGTLTEQEKKDLGIWSKDVAKISR